jgi:hypothetical protein
VVRTGKRALALVSLLELAGVRTGGSAPPGPRLADLGGDVAESIIGLYRSLGGNRPTPTLRPGKWDLVLEDDLLIELDEELHFNRYRRATLEPKWAHMLPWRDDYARHCDQMEGICLSAGSWGKRWSTPSCEAMFGSAGPPGRLLEGGAPRWKQRALYDAIKDGYAATRGSRSVARVSVHDRVGGLELGRVLEGCACVDPTDVVALIRRRTV